MEIEHQWYTVYFVRNFVWSSEHCMPVFAASPEAARRSVADFEPYIIRVEDQDGKQVR